MKNFPTFLGRRALAGLALASFGLTACKRNADTAPQPLTGQTPAQDVADNCGGATVALTTGGVTIYKLKQSGFTNVYTYTAGMAVDADGSPWCYNSPNIGSATALDNGSNSTGDSRVYIQGRNGAPVAYGALDFFVSQTSCAYPGFSSNNPQKWVDAENIPYVVIPGSLYAQPGNGIRPGNLAYAYNKRTGRGVFAICADVGPTGKAGEGSYNLAQQLGLANPSPKNGGQSGDVVYVIFAGTGTQGVARPLSTFYNEGISWYKNGGLGILQCLGAASNTIPLLGFELSSPLVNVQRSTARDYKITGYPRIERVKIVADGQYTVYDKPTSFASAGAELTVSLTLNSPGVRDLNIQGYDANGNLLTSFTRRLQVF